MLDFNPTGEYRLAASDGRRIIMSSRQSTLNLRRSVNDATERGLTVLAVCLYNCSDSYIYEWRNTLQTRTWLNCRLKMARRRGEYARTQDALILPAREQRYALGQFEQRFLGGRRNE